MAVALSGTCAEDAEESWEEYAVRRIHIEGRVWEYSIGRGSAVIKSPDGKRSDVRLAAIKGGTPNDFERGQWKRTSDGMVTPSEVKVWILANLRATP